MTVLLKKEEFPPILHTMLTNPDCISHMLFVGPPGSGKTTTAQSFAMAIHGKTTNSFSSLLFLNSSDERSLDMIRNKIYPFVESRMQSLFFTSGKVPPKVIIFDEAETLTDQAQIALRPLLDTPAQDVLLIFLCNSVSRIHSSILHKFLTIQLEAPSANEFTKRLEKIQLTVPTTGIDILYRRGDIRFFLLHPQKHNECAKIWSTLFTIPAYEVHTYITTLLQTWIYPELVMFFLVITKELNILTAEALYTMLRITDSDFLRICPPLVRIKLLSSWVEENLYLKLDAPVR